MRHRQQHVEDVSSFSHQSADHQLYDSDRLTCGVGPQVPQLAALRHNDAWHLASVLAAAPSTHPQLAELSSDSGRASSQQLNGGGGGGGRCV